MSSKDIDSSRRKSKHADPASGQDKEQEAAAKKVQHTWRDRNDAKPQFLNSKAQWNEAVDNAELQKAGDDAMDGNNTSKARWKRASKFVGRLQDSDPTLKSAGPGELPDADKKSLETQHWLELIDAKHRYGSNLKYYFKLWQQSDTTDNFFKWLDHGDGKELDLKECPRKQLEEEQITYLNNEQRLNYLVSIDERGKLRWARNNELVDTTAGHWKDAGDGRGIVPLDSEDVPPPTASRSLSSLSSAESDAASDAAQHYVGPPKGSNKLSRAMYKNLTVKGLMDKLLRKTIQKNTWIYVADKNYNIFIGIKSPGHFQHSSFLGGAMVTSAGLITVKNGTIHTLSPLSGHYRTTINHFHQFLDVLKERKVDMSKVKATKAEFALWLIEHIAKAKKKKSSIVDKTKGKAKSLVSGDKQAQEDGDDEEGEQPAWKRAALEGRKKPEETTESGKDENKNQEGTNHVDEGDEAHSTNIPSAIDRQAEGRGSEHEVISSDEATSAPGPKTDRRGEHDTSPA